MQHAGALALPDYGIDTGRFVVRTFEPSSARERLIEFWRSCWTEQQGLVPDLGPKCDWFYLGNPAGNALGCDLQDRTTGEQVGLLMVAPREFRLDGRPAVGGVFVEFIVAPNHRNGAAALTLLVGAHLVALERFDLIFGLPNRRARRLLERARQLLQRVDDSFRFERPRFATVLRYGPYVARTLPQALARPVGATVDFLVACRRYLMDARLPALQYQWLDDVDERFDELWMRAPLSGRCMGVRDRAFLHWRFVEQSGRCYRILAVSAPGERRLIAYFVVENVAQVLAVRDTLCVGSPAEQVSAWVALRRAAKELGAHGITCDIQADKDTLDGLRRSGMRVRGKTAAFVKLADATASDRWRNGDVWYLTAADEDT